MEQSPYWEATSQSSSQESSKPLHDPQVYYHVHKSQPLVPILNQMHPVHNFHPISLRFILILSSYLRLYLPSGLVPSGFPILNTFLFFSMHAVCPTHLLFLRLITLIILVKGTSYEALHYAVLSSLPLDPPSWIQIFSSTPCFQIPTIYIPPLVRETKFHTHTKNT
jgi:hypothetical protein